MATTPQIQNLGGKGKLPKIGTYYETWKGTSWRSASRMVTDMLGKAKEVEGPEAKLMIRVIEQALEDAFNPTPSLNQRDHEDAIRFIRDSARHEPVLHQIGVDPGYFRQVAGMFLPYLRRKN